MTVSDDEKVNPPIARPKGALQLLVIVITAYTLSQFYRTSVGVIAPELSAELDLSAAALGTLGGAFFIVFALAQVPCGIMLDRFGPRLVNCLLLLIAVAGAIAFAAAHTAEGLIAARGILGLGCATAYMGALVLFTRWFPARMFPFLAGLVIGIGGAGSLLATSPLAHAANMFGWRIAFYGIAALTLVVAALVWVLVRDAPPGKTFHTGSPEKLKDAIKGLSEIARLPAFHYLIPLNTVSYASLAAVLGLWGVPFLRDVHGLSSVGAADTLLFMAVGLMTGSIAYGWITPRARQINGLALGGAAIVVLLLLSLAFLPPQPTAGHSNVLLYLIFAVLGLSGAYSIALVAHIRALLRRELVGRGMTLANLFNFGGVGVVQVLSGLIVGFFPQEAGAYPPVAYTVLFVFLAVLISISALIYRRAEIVSVGGAHGPAIQR